MNVTAMYTHYKINTTCSQQYTHTCKQHLMYCACHRSATTTSMATQEAQDETIGYSTNHDQLTPAAQVQQTDHDEGATNMESSIKGFRELSSMKIDDDVSTSASAVQVSVTSLPVEQTTRTTAPETSKDGSAMLLIPSQDSPLIKRNWIRKESLCDDNCSSAVEKLENALKEVKEYISQSDQAAAKYQEKIANAGERERPTAML